MKRVLTVLALSVALLAGARFLLFKQLYVVSSAFAPTLQTGDSILMSRLAYGASRHSFAALSRWFPKRLLAALPQRGDVVVVKLPRDGQTDFVSRVIGLPGDTVQMQGGRLILNGVTVERVALPPVAMADRDGKPVPVQAYAETLPGGVRHTIIEVEGDSGRLDATAVFIVPAENYFLMGDNRDNSIDSRLPDAFGLGFVPYENFVGRVWLVLYAFGRSPDQQAATTASFRRERLLQIVR